MSFSLNLNLPAEGTSCSPTLEMALEYGLQVLLELRTVVLLTEIIGLSNLGPMALVKLCSKMHRDFWT